MRLARVAGMVLLGAVLFSSVACATPTYNLSTSVNGQGSVMPSSGDFLENEDVILLAVPASGCDFDHWEGAASGNDSLVTITMNSDKSVTAYFVETWRGEIETISGFEIYADYANKFAMSMPATWGVVSFEDLGTAFYSDPLNIQSGPYCLVGIGFPQGTDRQTIYEAHRMVAEMSEGYTFISEEEPAINGISALVLMYTQVSEGNTLQCLECVLVRGDMFWDIQFLCPSESWDVYEDTFNIMLDSFHVLY